MNYSDTIPMGTRVKSLWNNNEGEVLYNSDLSRSAGELWIKWGDGTKTKEVWRVDVEPMPANHRGYFIR